MADVPWYDLVPLLFSKAMGGMGRVEIWNGRWGSISDTNFIYIGDSVSAGGARELKLNLKTAAGDHSGSSATFGRPEDLDSAPLAGCGGALFGGDCAP